MFKLSLLLAQVSFMGWAVVVDGDTIRIGNSYYRLEGVNAPEMSERYGPESRAEMQRIIGADNVTCSWTGDMSHKRYVAVCSTLHHRDIGAELIRRGFALDCARFSGGRYRHLEPADARTRLPEKPYCNERHK